MHEDATRVSEHDRTSVAPVPGWSGPDAAPAAPIAAPASPVSPASLPAVAGTIGVPGAPVIDERGNLPAGLLGLAGAATVVAGVFLPWLTVEGHDVSGWSASNDAKVLLGLAAAATVVAALLVGGARSLVLRLVLVGIGLAALGLTVFEVASVGAVDDFDATAGVGLLVSIGGSVAIVLAGLVARHRRFR